MELKSIAEELKHDIDLLCDLCGRIYEALYVEEKVESGEYRVVYDANPEAGTWTKRIIKK